MKEWWQAERRWRTRRVRVVVAVASRLAVASTLTAVTSRLPAVPPMTAALAERALRPTSWKQVVGMNVHRQGLEQQRWASHRVLDAPLPAASSGLHRSGYRER